VHVTRCVVGPGPNGPAPTSCPPCVAQATFKLPPIQTVTKEVVQVKELTPPGWWKEILVQFDDILDRKLKIAKREHEISRCEETVNCHEHDALSPLIMRLGSWSNLRKSFKTQSSCFLADSLLPVLSVVKLQLKKNTFTDQQDPRVNSSPLQSSVS
jgi:hypothetical protein